MNNLLDNYPSFYSLSENRYSCRNFSDAPVSRESILAVIDAVRLSPSACNRQPWMFLVADTPELKQYVIESYDREWIKSAPAMIIACGLHSEAWHRGNDGKDHTDVDVAIATEHLCLAATSLGLATCWVCNFDTSVIRKYFDLPADVEPIAIIPIGYAADTSYSPAKKRKQLDQIVKWGKY